MAAIIQYLIWKNKVEKGEKTNLHYTFKDFTNSKFGGNTLSNWKIIKFADKLKDIVCLLIGCTRKQLEDRDFKETSLGVEWRVFKHTLDNSILSPQEMSIQHALHNGFRDCFYEEINLTPRLFLQKIGTDLFRNQLHPNIWVNSLMSEYKPFKKEGGFQRSVKSEEGIPYDFEYEIEYPNWIITDVRFVNEADAVKSRGGINIRIDRPNLLNNQNNINLEHISETSLDDYKFNYYICNDSSIENLIEQVKNILIKEKLL